MTPKPIAQNTLFYGDNLPVLREYVPDESIDLVYLDPPFNPEGQRPVVSLPGSHRLLRQRQVVPGLRRASPRSAHARAYAPRCR
jgi:16S rRNA G966 N2-methylase RsmD